MAHYKGAANEANRAMNILKRREKAKEELELKKKKLDEDLKLKTIDDRFATHHDSIESQLRSSTVGLVTLSEIRQKQIDAEEERERQIARNEFEKSNASADITNKQIHKQATAPKKTKIISLNYSSSSSSSGSDDDNDRDNDEGKLGLRDNDEKRPLDDEDGSQNKPSSKKSRLSPDEEPDLDVDTSLLPDRQREEDERRLREKLAREWRERQEKLKKEAIEITFSYWDGSGHRRVVNMLKGNTIQQFLQACLDNLRKDHSELRVVTADQLMYIKEDLIIPHHYTFYDFIVTKARGKSGPLFSFDVHDDVRLIADASVEKDESHAGKVLTRSWYERNKHIFPASRWEPYDPTKSYDKYTISDKKSN